MLVQGVFDEGQLENPGGEFARMLTEGLDVRLDGNPDKLHHKVIVIDGRVVITGSYNFSVSAEERNDENVVIIFNEAVAQVYLQEVQRVVGDHHRWVADEAVQDLRTFDAVFMRKDPPFNMDYIFATYILDLAAKSTHIINNPEGLRNCNEKAYILNFPAFTPPTMLAPDSG